MVPRGTHSQGKQGYGDGRVTGAYHVGVKEQVKLSVVHYWCPVFQSLVLINVICPAIREPFTLLAVIRLVYGLTQGYPIVQCCIRSTEQTKEERRPSQDKARQKIE